MRIAFTEIFPSPWNPKKKFHGVERKRVQKSLEEYPGLVTMILCHRYDKTSGYYCLDGNSRLSILQEIGVSAVDAKICNEVDSLKKLKKFITVFDSTRKKYNMAEVAKEIGVSFSCDEISNFIQFNPVEYELKKQEQTLQYDSFEVEQFFLTLPKGTAGTYRNFFRKASTVENEGKIELLLNKITDEEIITFILGYRE